MSNQSDRRKLKPKRNDNKFEHLQPSTSRQHSINDNDEEVYVPQRVSKRTNTELSDLPDSKKRCYGLIHPPLNRVNLANNRLNKLKQNLQAGLEVTKASTTESSSTNTPGTSTGIIRNEPGDHLKVPISPSGSSKNIYENLNKWASPPEGSSSNSANDRLSRLKKVINDTKYTGSPRFSDSSGISNNARALTEISYTPQCSFNSPKSQHFENKYQFDRGRISNSGTLNKPINILNQFSSSSNKHFVETKDSNVKTGYIDKSINHLSSRILKIRKNTEQLTSSVSSDVFSKYENVIPPTNTTSVSERLKLVRNVISPIRKSKIINSKPSLDVQTNLQVNQMSSSPISDRVKLNRNFAPLINNNFNPPTLNNSFNDNISKTSPSPESNFTSKLNNLNTQKQPTYLFDAQKQISPISERLKLNKQISTSLSPTGDKNLRPCNVNNNLAQCSPVNDQNYIIKVTPLSERMIIKSNINNRLHSSTQLFDTRKQNLPISERLTLNRQTTKIMPCNLNNNLAQRSPVNDQNDIIKATPSSERTILKSNIRLNSSTQSFDTQKHNSSISERMQLKRKSTTPPSPTGNAKNVMPFTFKEQSVPILTQESLKILNNPLQMDQQANKDEFDEKMKMTATWIKDQKFSDTIISNSSQTLDNSVKSDAATMDDSEMEWLNAEPEFSFKREIPVEKPTRSDPQKVVKEQKLCVIVDTNVFINDLSKLNDILTLKISGPVQPMIFIPWMVVTELDELKDRNKGDSVLKKKASDAIKFINKALSEENPRVKGQSVSEMGIQHHIGTSPDDKIMGTCLQALEKYESVILLSNDLNLKNKAMINNVAASSANEIIMKIISRLVKTTKTQKIKQKMGMLCSEIICESAKEAYGDVWIKMDMLSNPPWPFLECLKRFKKYWTAVFQDKLLKHFLAAVEKLQKLMTDNKEFCDDSSNYVEFVKLSLNLCIFLKDIEDYRGSVENVIKDITKIG